jgi:hypothetical membrane protein
MTTVKRVTTPQRSVLQRAPLAAGIVGPILFIAVFTVAGWLRPRYSATAEAVSDLGVGEAAWIQNANFFVFGALLLAFATGFRRAMSGVVGRRASTVAAVMIATTGIGLAAGGAFPAAPPTEGLHFLVGFLLTVVSAIATTFYVGRRLRGTEGWQRVARYSMWSGIGALALVAFSFVALNPASPLEDMGIGGLIERLLVIEVFAWHAGMGWRLLVHDATQSTAPPDGQTAQSRREPARGRSLSSEDPLSPTREGLQAPPARTPARDTCARLPASHLPGKRRRSRWLPVLTNQRTNHEGPLSPNRRSLADGSCWRSRWRSPSRWAPDCSLRLSFAR